jgi:hypothetical protein
VRGGNYGWNIREGAHCYGPGECATPNLIDPVAEYDHAEGCSITGGFVYRGTVVPLQGAYIYGDFCSGTVWSLTPDQSGYRSQVLAQTELSIASFAEDAAGELFIVDMSGGIYGLQPVTR